MTLRISTKYRTSSDVKLLKFSYQISDTMNDNPVYDNPTPTQSALHGACDNFRLACSVSNRKDRALLSAKNDRKDELIGLLDELNIYVTDKCKGDKTMLLQSGFELVGLKNESKILKPITDVEVKSELPGTATIRVSRSCRCKVVCISVYNRPAFARQCVGKPNSS